MGHAHADRVAPVRRLARVVRLHVYGEGWGEHGVDSRGVVVGEPSLAVLASAACVVVFKRGLHGDPLVKPSLFDFTAAGALVVTEYDPAVAPCFAFGEEIVGFDGEEGLVAAVRRILDDRADAERIGQAGMARTLRDHTWARAWRTMLDAVRADGP